MKKIITYIVLLFLLFIITVFIHSIFENSRIESQAKISSSKCMNQFLLDSVNRECYIAAKDSINTTRFEDYRMRDSLEYIRMIDSLFNNDLTILPRFSPWPPPKPTSELNISDICSAVDSMSYYSDVENCLNQALLECGYEKKSFFEIPGGFALITQIEQINSDGSPKTENRWTIECPTPEFTLSAFLKSIFISPKGFYRVVLFTYTNKPFSKDLEPFTSEKADKAINSGVVFLPQYMADNICTPSHNLIALIYEFEFSQGGNPKITYNSQISARDHLSKSGVLQRFKELLL